LVSVKKIHRKDCKKREFRSILKLAKKQQERNSQMTENSVQISIAIKIEDEEIKYKKAVAINELEEDIQELVQEMGHQVIKASIQAIDDRVALEVPESWRNAGTEGRWLISSLGAIKYRRRIYLDERKRRRKPVDELLGIERYGRVSKRVQEMGSSLAGTGTYRLAAKQLSWLIKTPISHSAIQRMAWEIGSRIADGEEAERRRIFETGGQLEAGKIKAPVLYGESDGVWVHLQREKRKSAEVRVGILSTGRKQIGKDRYRLENKHCITAIGLNSMKWQEQILREAHLTYDLEQTQLLIIGGDGNQWVRHSFDRIELPQEFILDRFHLHRAARRAYQDRVAAKEMVEKLRQKGFAMARHELIQQIEQAEGRKKDLLLEFYKYVQHNQDGLLDLEKRGYTNPVYLGAIEGNVDKLVVHRIKGRGCSWRLPGLRAMLALCRYGEELKCHAYQYLPVQMPEKMIHRLPNVEVEYSETIIKPMPILHGPDQAKPWVKRLSWFIHGRKSLFC
jgi:hypothetical protein